MNYIVVDIETTGTTVKDTVTTIGYGVNGTYYICYRLPKGLEQDSDLTQEISEKLPERLTGDVIFFDFPDQESLIENSLQVVEEAEGIEGNNYPLVGYNSDDFDFPLLRSFAVQENVAWPFTGREAIDLMKSYRYKFHTRVPDINGLKKNQIKAFGEKIGTEFDSGAYKDELVEAVENHPYNPKDLSEFLEQEEIDTPTTEEQSLDGIFDILIGEDLDDVFEDSKEAVAAFEKGEIADVIIHNAIDIYKTDALTKAMFTYADRSEIKSRRL